MNEIIKNIEAAQLKENVAQFNVGDTVKVYILSLDKENNKISLFVRFIDIETGETESRIINKNK